jgi:hypothetical protein
MRALALAAVMLLALMPSVARFLAVHAGAQPRAGWVELCTMSGLKLVKLDATAPAAPDHGVPTHGGDCDYCPLLHSLTPAATSPAMALAALPPLPAPALRAAQRTPDPAATGLGSRGPPALA